MWRRGVAILTLLFAVGATNVYDFTARDIDGKLVKLADRYNGTVLLIVNVATFCDATAVNYRQLQALYEKHRDRGFRVAAFPCGQFRCQEIRDNMVDADIKELVKAKYNVTFDLYHKIEVNGPRAIPLYEYLKYAIGGGREIGWNFAKFLINRRGVPVHRSLPIIEPYVMEKYILRELNNVTVYDATWVLAN